MNDKELDNYIKIINPDFNSHIEKGTIEMNNEYYNLLEEKMARLINQNQELKSQLKGTTHCFDEEEHKRLKEQLENSIKVNMADHKYASECEDKVVTLEAHQKEFIKYLQEELNVQIQEESIGCETTNKRHILQEILQKYKLIIGDDKNGTN